jgi:hypothetical protein
VAFRLEEGAAGVEVRARPVAQARAGRFITRTAEA